MIIMCQHIDNLRDLGYVDGRLIYLQKININTDFPSHLNTGIFCIDMYPI